MTPKEQAAMQQALEALEGGLWDYGPGQDEHDKCNEVTTALREALAEQAEQEPVAKVFEYALSSARQLLDYADDSDGCQYGTLSTSLVRDAMEQILPALIAATQPMKQEPVAEWEKLKDPQTLFVNLNRGFPAKLTHGHLLHLLNKTEQAEQEPVAIMSPNKANIVGINTPYANIGTDDWIKLYAAPVRTKDLPNKFKLARIARETGLAVVKCTQSDGWDRIETEADFSKLPDFALAVIAAYKEKNR